MMFNAIFLCYNKNATDNLQKTTTSWWNATDYYNKMAMRCENGI